MASAFTHHYETPFPSSSLPLFQSPLLQPPRLHLSITPKSKTSPLILYAADPPSIFLPLLQQQEEDNKNTQREEEDEEEEELSLREPIVKFFKSRTSSPIPDPPLPGKLSLQTNRRSGWHLSSHSFSDPEENEEEEEEEQNQQEEASGKASVASSSSIVDEILEIARSLPENVTLGERLTGCYEGKVSKEECVELLELMGESGLAKCGLYLFEWMGLQDPSLVTPRACSVLLPVLGKNGLGDELIFLFRNLPKRKEFWDVHVYNSAISGLLCCGRYDDACKVFDDMEANNVTPDHVTCCIMITIMRKNGCSAKEVWEFFEKMNRKGVKWSQEVLGALVKAFCDEGLKNEALIIQTEMARKGIFPNAIV